jgi:hypothetical protein
MLLLRVADFGEMPTSRGMKTFEEFQASREKMDPSTRKLSEHQWGQAYAAYCSSRENARGAHSSRSKGGAPRRRSSTKSSGQGMHAPSTLSASGALKAHVRAESAYADLRLIVNLLSWVILGAIVIVAILQGVSYSSPAATGVALLSGAIKALSVVVLRLIAQVIIDIPDVALYRASEAQKVISISEVD